MKKTFFSVTVFVLVGLVGLTAVTSNAESSEQPAVEIVGARVRTPAGSKNARYVTFNIRNNDRERAIIYINYTIHLYGDDGIEVFRREGQLNNVPTSEELNELISPGESIGVTTKTYESYLWQTTRAEINIRAVELWDGNKNEWTFIHSL